MDFVINNTFWKIKFVNSSNKELQKSDKTFSIGCTDFNKKTIFICDKLKGSLLKKVICHEICHSFVMSYEISMSIDEEERLCDFVATYGRDIIDTTDMILSDFRSELWAN